MTDTEKTALKEKCDLQFPGGGDNMPCKSTWENTRVGQEEGEGRSVGRSLYCGLQEWQGKTR